MTKREFIAQLQKKLQGLPKQEVEERISFYGEMIEDRMEEGMEEPQAVADVGTVEEISAQIISEIPLTKIAKERVKPKRRWETWEIVLLALGSPIWLSLVVAAFAVVLSLYIVLWSVVVALWSVFVSLVACALFVTVAGIILAIIGNRLQGVAMIGAGIACMGSAIIMFIACKAATKGVILLTKMIALGVKKCFVKKESM